MHHVTIYLVGERVFEERGQLLCRPYDFAPTNFRQAHAQGAASGKAVNLIGILGAALLQAALSLKIMIQRALDDLEPLLS